MRLQRHEQQRVTPVKRGFFKKVIDWFKGQKVTQTKMDMVHPLDRMDPKMVKSRLPRSIFTQKLTAGRRKRLRDILLMMTPQQRLLARAHGWDKGLVTREGKVRK